MKHIFDIELATRLESAEKATVLENFAFWIRKNIANNKNFHDDNVYTYNSYGALQELFPYIKLNKLKRIIRELENDGILRSRTDLNESKWDKTKWYCFTDLSIMKLLFADSELAKLPMVINLTIDEYKNNHDYSTNINADINADINTYIKEYKENSTKKDFKEKKKTAHTAERELLGIESNKAYIMRTNVRQLTDKCPHSIEEYSIDQVRLEEIRLDKTNLEDFKNLWNEMATKNNLAKIRILTNKRKTQLNTRLEESEDFKSLFVEALLNIPKAPFLLGESQQGWRIDFDWLIQNDTNLLKVVEGKYIKKEKSNRLNNLNQIDYSDTEQAF